ncbi:hypothetical protein [Veillonella sp. 3310]|uniref:hypothetical protein n=1 Tax=Veillonella sp. 3310 TaxID=2490956 RepID=UPI000FD67586|nr:hypothetical protein [Veillonella sp. 3310]
METITINRSELLKTIVERLVKADKWLEEARKEDGTINTDCLAFVEFARSSTIADAYIELGGFTDWEVADAVEELEKAEA